MIRCAKCLVEKQESEFSASELVGRRKVRRCRECERGRARAYNAAHREERAAYSRKWFKKHSGYSRAHHREWVKKHPERAKEISAKWRNLKQRPYRYVAAEMLGRPLRRGEHVHHVNCNDQDNRPENLWVCTGTQHRRAHGTLNRLVERLMEQGVIRFSREAGQYEFAAP